MEAVKSCVTRRGDEVTIRHAGPEDACEIIQTIHSSAPERSYVLMEQYGLEIASEISYISDLDRLKNLLIVSTMGIEVVGCLAALQSDGGKRPETADCLNVGLHLKEEYRGMGIGSLMLEYATDWARERGFRKMEASIFTSNKRSIKLFSKAGFLQEGTKAHGIRIGAEYVEQVLMVKRL